MFLGLVGLGKVVEIIYSKALVGSNANSACGGVNVPNGNTTAC